MSGAHVISDFPSGRHNHRSCVQTALRQAEAVCESRGMRLTELRRHVLELVWSRHGPVKAYDLLRMMDESKGNPTPNTVYRALDFLLEAGLIHRLDSRNAFMGCGSPTVEHSAQFLICRECGSAAEIHDPAVNRNLRRDAEALGFTADAPTVEVSGVCPACAE